jgi:hypothetical protein
MELGADAPCAVGGLSVAGHPNQGRLRAVPPQNRHLVRAHGADGGGGEGVPAVLGAGPAGHAHPPGPSHHDRHQGGMCGTTKKLFASPRNFFRHFSETSSNAAAKMRTTFSLPLVSLSLSLSLSLMSLSVSLTLCDSTRSLSRLTLGLSLSLWLHTLSLSHVTLGLFIPL